MIDLVQQNKSEIGIKAACLAFDIPESSYHRWEAQKNQSQEPKPKNKHPRALSDQEESEVLENLNNEKFVDKSPAAVKAILLDEGKYLCSTSTMYRILKKNNAVKERRDQKRRPDYHKPELIATGPNQVWTWDITKIRTGQKCVYHHLYVIIDMFSRYVVGWAVHSCEDATFAKDLIEETCEKQKIKSGQLTIHADRGAAMRSQTVSELMSTLGINKSHSRPYVSDDNPYSESQFKTLKYHSTYPKIITTIEEARHYLRDWFNWYNNEHRHSGIAMLSPVDVHTGRHKKVLANRQKALNEAYKKHPERFPKGCPKIQKLDRAVWINKPKVAV
jgi:putative transposase